MKKRKIIIGIVAAMFGIVSQAHRGEAKPLRDRTLGKDFWEKGNQIRE